LNKSYLIAIDTGVSFTKIGIYDSVGNAVCITNKSNSSYSPQPGVFIQSADEILGTVLDTLKESIDEADIDVNEIEAISFSGAMGGAMGVDKNWNIITDWSIVSDTRFNPYVMRMLKNSSKKILKLSGTNFPIFSPKLLWWKNEFPGEYKKVSKFMFLCGYIIGKMGGLKIEDAFVDRTYLSFTGIADIPNNKWSEELISEFNIDKRTLPGIVGSNEIIGRLDEKISKICNLPSGIPLVAGAGDKPAGSLGAGITEPGLLIDESATFGALSLCSDKYTPDTRNKALENLLSPIEGLNLPSFFLNGAGTTHEWFKNVFGYEEKIEAEKIGKSTFQILDEKASKVSPGSDKLMALGLLGGRGYPRDPNIKGMWIGHSWFHKKEHFFRSLLESHAYEYGHIFNIMKKNYPDLNPEEIIVVGGGSKSDLYNQIKSDLMGIDYIKLNREDSTLLGTVILAGNAIGMFEDLKETAKRFVKKVKSYKPDMKNHKTYKSYLKTYEGLFDKVRSIFDEL